MSATRNEAEAALIEVFEEELTDLTPEQHRSIARQSIDRLIQEGVEIDAEDDDEEESDED